MNFLPVLLVSLLISVAYSCNCNEDDKEKEKEKETDGGKVVDEEENFKKIILDQHNEYRRQENAKSMTEMVWDDKLAFLAKLWGEQCIWKHGRFLDRPEGEEFRKVGIGENLFLKHGKSLDPASPIRSWANEKNYYSYDTGACAKGKMCGHYTQVVWAKSVKVGCAATYCPSILKPKTKTHTKDTTFVVCYYYPPGNYKGQSPYATGQKCSACPSDKKLCRNSLCSSCQIGESDCTCQRQCKNCGVKTSDCSCNCQAGYSGLDCSDECVDRHEYCGKSPGWPAWTCQHGSFGQTVRSKCPKMCGLCKAAPNGQKPKC